MDTYLSESGVFGFNWCQLTLHIKLSKVKKGHTKARNSKVKNYHYNSMMDSGHSSVPFVLIGDNLHHQIIKSKKTIQRPEKAKSKVTTITHMWY